MFRSTKCRTFATLLRKVAGCSSARFRVRVWGACGRKFESCHPDFKHQVLDEHSSGTFFFIRPQLQIGEVALMRSGRRKWPKVAIPTALIGLGKSWPHHLRYPSGTRRWWAKRGQPINGFPYVARPQLTPATHAIHDKYTTKSEKTENPRK